MQGAFTHDLLPRYDLAAGLSTELGTLIPPGGEVVAYVRSSGPVDGDHPDIVDRIYTTLNAALNLCRTGRGDVVVVLPGHAENIAAADAMSNLKAGTVIIGCGYGTMRPTFTWTAAAATWLFNVANVQLHNCILYLASSGNAGVTVAAPITVSAASCTIGSCDIFFGDDADDIVTIGITTTAAATDFSFVGNKCFGATAAECTTFMQLVGAVRARLLNNVIVGASSAAAVGLIRFLTTASTDVVIDGLHIRNNKASSSQAITGMAGISGYANNLFMAVLANTATELTGAFGTPANMVFGLQCGITNTIGERAASFGTVSA